MEETTGKTAGGRERDASGREALSGLHYYLQDELGSPLRVSGYGEGADIPGYLTYGYDEFGNDLGNDLGKELDEAGIPNPYDRQGEEQPFGYTGYRYDEISGTYFAQAREYQTGNGRFTAEDVIKGNGIKPETLNRYGYCWRNPLVYVDKNGMQPEESEDESQKWMENRGHSYWYTEKGLHEGNVALPLDSDKLRMSEQGKEVLKGFELDVESEWNEDIVVRDEITNEVVAVYPYYVGDGGITFGYGHYMNYDEVMEYQTEKDLFTKYVNGKEIDSEIFDDGLGLKVKPRIVPGSVPVPLEELNQLFEEDVEKMTGDMLKNFDKTDLMLTIQQVDALVLIRFNTGHLGSDLVSLVENGATKEEWDKIINSQSSDRKLSAKDIYWGNIFTYNEYLDERNCIE